MTRVDPVTLAGNLREAISAVLLEHRSPVYGACSCGWRVPNYPYSNGASLWRGHVEDLIVARTFPFGDDL